MNRKRSITIIMTLALAALTIASVAGAADARPRRGNCAVAAGAGGPGTGGFGGGARCDGPRAELRAERMAQILDLTEQQQADIEQLREQHREKVGDTRREIQKLRLEMGLLRLEDQPDKTKMERIVRRMGELKTDIQLERLDHRFEMRKLLTPEQIEKFDRMRPMRGRDGMRCGSGCRGGRGGFDGRGGRGGSGRSGGMFQPGDDDQI